MTKTAIKKNPAQDASSREIVITRIFDSPRERVFEAWTDPEQKAQWWGPNGFTVTTREHDMRPGGKWLHTMHGPDGVDYLSKTIFEEVVRPERIVYTNSGGKKGAPGVHFRTTVTFKDLGGKTELTLRMVFDSAEARDLNVKTYKSIEGGKQTLARLAEYLEKGPLILER